MLRWFAGWFEFPLSPVGLQGFLLLCQLAYPGFDLKQHLPGILTIYKGCLALLVRRMVSRP